MRLNPFRPYDPAEDYVLVWLDRSRAAERRRTRIFQVKSVITAVLGGLIVGYILAVLTTGKP